MSGSMTSLPSSASTRTISDEGLLILRARGDSASVSEGFRTISASSYSPPGSVMEEVTVVIPDHLESIETLLFLELNQKTAERVWKFYIDDLEQRPDRAHLLKSAVDYVWGVSDDTIDGEDNWDTMFESIGLTKDFKDRVMAPEWKEMRLMDGVKQMTVDMMDGRYRFLESLDSLIKTPALGIQRKISTISLNGKLEAKPEVPSRGSSKPSYANVVAGPSKPKVTAQTETAPDHIENHYWFYRGSDLNRLKRIELNGSFEFGRITSSIPGDFSAYFGGVYLTQDLLVAIEYAQWAGVKQGKPVPMGILQVGIPSFLMSSVMEVASHNWRKYVWACRRQEHVPQDLSHYTQYHWLTGAICGQATYTVQRMRHMGELTRMRLPVCSHPKQHFASNPSIVSLLTANCQGKVWITAIEPEEPAKS